MTWQPTRIIAQLEAALSTSTAAVRVRTDAGDAFCKAIGAPDEPPMALACDWIGSRLGQLLGVPVPAVAICQTDLPLVLDDLGRCREPGPVFLSQEIEDTETWDGEAKSLATVDNPEVLAGGALLDTWILNHDRHGYLHNGQPRVNTRNLLLQKVKRGRSTTRRLLWLIDHTHCLTRRDGGGFARRIDAIDHVQDHRLFGLFPAAIPQLTPERARPWVDQLRSIDRGAITAIMEAVPHEWEVSAEQRQGLLELLLRRRDFLCDSWLTTMNTACNWQQSILDGDQEDN